MFYGWADRPMSNCFEKFLCRVRRAPPTAYCSRLTAHSYNIILMWAFSRKVLTQSAKYFSISC
jgi:hypothetical protein